MKLLSGEEAAQAVVSLAHRYASFDPKVEKTVAGIVSRVRSGGDASLLEYAHKFDGLAKGAPMRVPAEELRAAVGKVSAEFIRAVEHRGEKYSQFCRVATAPPLDSHHSTGAARRSGGSPSGVGGLLRSRRPVSAALDGADDGDPRTGRGGQAHCSSLAESRAGDAGGRGHHRGQRVLPDWRRAGDCGLCLRHAEHSCGE